MVKLIELIKKEVKSMDMYQKRKVRKEMKNNENKEEMKNKTNINCEE